MRKAAQKEVKTLAVKALNREVGQSRGCWRRDVINSRCDAQCLAPPELLQPAQLRQCLIEPIRMGHLYCLDFASTRNTALSVDMFCIKAARFG